MTILSHTTPKAKKEHRCDLCSKQIVVGDVYVNQRNVYEGTLYTWKGHLACQAVLGEMYRTRSILEDDDQEGAFDLFLGLATQEQIMQIVRGLPDSEQDRLLHLWEEVNA